MKEELYIYYDKEGDFLEINIGNYEECYFNDINDNVTEIRDEKN